MHLSLLTFVLAMLWLYSINFGIFSLYFYMKIFFFDLLLFPLTQWLFKRMLLSFHVFYNFLVFLLLVVSSFLSLSSEKILRMMLIFSNLLKFVLWLNMWSFLEIVMSVLEKNAFFCCWRVLYMSARFVWSTVLFRSAVSLLIVWIFVSSIQCRVWKLPLVLHWC